MGRGAEPPSPISSSLACFFAPLLAVPPMAPRRKFSAAEKVKAPREGPSSSAPKRSRGRPRKHTATPAVAHCRGGAAARGGGHPSHGGPVDEGRRAMVVRPPVRASTRRRCRRSLSSGRRTRPATGSNFRASSSVNCRPLVQADGCCSKASWVAVETSAMGNIALARG